MEKRRHVTDKLSQTKLRAGIISTGRNAKANKSHFNPQDVFFHSMRSRIDLSRVPEAHSEVGDVGHHATGDASADNDNVKVYDGRKSS